MPTAERIRRARARQEAADDAFWARIMDEGVNTSPLRAQDWLVIPPADKMKCCAACGKTFAGKRSDALFCSKDCKAAAHKKRMAAQRRAGREGRTAVCPYCGRIFSTEQRSRTYCSDECRTRATSERAKAAVRKQEDAEYYQNVKRFLAGDVVVVNDNIADDYIGIRKVKCIKLSDPYESAALTFDGLDPLADIDERDAPGARQPDFALGF